MGNSPSNTSQVYIDGSYKNNNACFFEDDNFRGASRCYQRGLHASIPDPDSYSSGTVQQGSVAFLWEHPNFEGERLQLNPGEHASFPNLNDRASSIKVLPNCHEVSNIWDSACNVHRDLFPELDEKRAGYCNSTTQRATSPECMAWCAENRTKCTQLTKQVACNKYNISDNDCTDDRIIDLENKCVKFGLIDNDSKTQTSRSLFQCNDAGISSLEAECKRLNLEGDKCTVVAIDNAIILQQMQDQTQKLKDTLSVQSELNRRQRQQTANEFKDVLKTSQEHTTVSLDKMLQSSSAESNRQVQSATNLLATLADKPTPRLQSNTQIYIIVVLVLMLLLMSSVGLLMLRR